MLWSEARRLSRPEGMSFSPLTAQELYQIDRVGSELLLLREVDIWHAASLLIKKEAAICGLSNLC